MQVIENNEVFAPRARTRDVSVLRGPNRPDLLRHETLSEILADTARRTPHKTALIWNRNTYAYEELNTLADLIGGALISRGAARGQVIGLCAPRGANLLLAQAGITKSGAAWLPFDAETPLERIKTCLASANATGLLTCAEFLPRLKDLPVPIWTIEDLLTEKPSPAPPHSAAKPSDPAYVIYTSGSTGAPKGIVISQSAICHFLRSENEILGIRETDLVYQGFSAAFDMSFEEIWISYLVGATLWVAPPQVVADPDALAQTLTRERITVLHAVPTLMALLDAPLPSVRLINLGGEACPDALAQRLLRPGRKVFNTYGPTETAVSTSLAELKSGEPVTIGLPLPNYGLLVADENHQPVPVGETGELCIFGPGLATGYLGLPELTAQKFIPNPAAENPAEDRMYLTGDLARIEPGGGPVHCLGRADNQVKIRGFRIELDEITAVLSAQPCVAAASVVVRPVADSTELVAFIVFGKNCETNADELRRALAARVPHYMIPAHFEFLPELPRLISGKIDAHALRAFQLKHAAPEPSSAPRNEDESQLYAALEKLFPGGSLRPDADFFNDLGGHSLFVARLVSLLRANEKYATLAIQDIYRERRLDQIARVMTKLREAQQPTTPPLHHSISSSRLCGIAQSIAIPFFVLLNMADWLAPFFVYHYFTGDDGDSIPLAVLYSLGTFVLVRLANFAIAIAGKWLAAGRLKPGRYPLWGVTYFRWWLANRFCELPDVYLLAATPWMPLYLRALGAKVGRDVTIDAVTLGAPELLTIEDGVSIGTFVNIENARVERGQLILGPVHLKRESVIESYAVLENDTQLGERSQLGGQSALAAGREIPDGETWEGAPARKSRAEAPPSPPLGERAGERGRSISQEHPNDPHTHTLPPRPKTTPTAHCLRAVLFAVTAILVSVLFFLPTFPAFMLIDWLDAHTVDVFDSNLSPLAAFGLFFVLAIPASALFVIVTMLVTAALRWMLPRQKAGIFSVNSLAFWRKKFMTLILDSSLRELHGLYASMFAPLWLRCLGVKVGRHAEISTAEGMVPELLTLGDDSFIADGALLGDEEQRGGWMILKPTKIGNRSFIGNGAYVPDGAVVPDDVLIGVQTRAPDNDQLKSGQTWMGSPALLLPAREQLAGFPENLTFRPSLKRRIARGIVEGLRIVLPLALIIATGYLIVILVMPLAADNGWGIQVAAALSAAGCLYGLASFLGVVALKWICIGRYKPRAAPMWTPFVWISEAVTNLYESLAVPNFLDNLRGTPMLPWALRLLGARIGKGVYLNTTDMTEHDCVTIGDHSELNAWCGPQTHLFEDRVMKIGTVEIGPRVTIGPRATILYDTQIAANVRLGPLTLVAKGERLPSNTTWHGSPASPL